MTGDFCALESGIGRYQTWQFGNVFADSENILGIVSWYLHFKGRRISVLDEYSLNNGYLCAELGRNLTQVGSSKETVIK